MKNINVSIIKEMTTTDVLNILTNAQYNEIIEEYSEDRFWLFCDNYRDGAILSEEEEYLHPYNYFNAIQEQKIWMN